MLCDLAARHRMGIVSNFTGNLAVCLAEVGLLKLFDTVVDSGNVGVAKPDLRLFRLALSRLASEPAFTWMVGDSPAADILPAATLGMKTCWLASADDRRALPPRVPTARITTLAQLTGVLDLPCTG